MLQALADRPPPSLFSAPWPAAQPCRRTPDLDPIRVPDPVPVQVQAVPVPQENRTPEPIPAAPTIVSIEDLFAALPSTPPTAFPRREWTSTAFGIPAYAAHQPVCADQLHWALKKASLCAYEASRTGDWAAVQDPQQIMALAICDKVLQVNDFWRGRHVATDGIVASIAVWERERARDIAIVFDEAHSVFPQHLFAHVKPAHVSTLAMAALRLHHECGLDSYEPCAPGEFARAWLGEHVPHPHDMAAFGHFTITGRISRSSPKYYSDLVAQSRKHREEHPPAERTAPRNAYHYPPPSAPPAC